MQKLQKEFGRASSPVWFLDWKNSEITTVYSLFFKTTLLLVFQENYEAHFWAALMSLTPISELKNDYPQIYITFTLFSKSP